MQTREAIQEGIIVRDLPHLLRVVKQGKAATIQCIQMQHQHVNPRGIKYVTDLLASGAFEHATYLQIQLWNTRFNEQGMRYLVDALQSKRCPIGLRLGLRSNDIHDDGIILLANALKSGACPSGLQIELWDNKISSAGVTEFAEAIESGQCPDGLTLNLGHNQISNDAIQRLMLALQSEQCPKQLTLNLSNNYFYFDAATSIAQLLNDLTCAKQLRLNLSGNLLRMAGALLIAKAMMKNTTVLDVQVDERYSPAYDIIQHCCLRNRLLLQYPDMQEYIKWLSHKAGCFVPSAIQNDALTLKCIAAKYLLFKPQPKMKQLPQDIMDYVDLMNLLKKSLDASTKRINYGAVGYLNN